ncbi:MAG: flagellar hook-basal body complex protein [Novosphingobium sp.]
MPDLVSAATAILSQAQRRVEMAGENVANATSPAYKRRIPFAVYADAAEDRRPVAPSLSAAIDHSPGKLVQTGNPYDLAIVGTGFFALRDGQGTRYARAGRFSRREDGRLVDALGGVLQSAAGADVIANGAGFEVRPDGEIRSEGAVAGRIGVFDTADPQRLVPTGGGFADHGSILELSAHAQVAQGSYEASNVSTGDEMVRMMEALRLAESGQRLMITYDDMMGRVISTFGDSVR